MSSSGGGSATDLWKAAAADDADALRVLLEDASECVDECDDQGRTCLHVAASVGSEAAVRFLLAQAADPNKADKESHWTPLHRALYHGHLRIALLLLRAGAVLGDELTPWRDTASKKASLHGGKVVENVGVDKDGLTPLSLLSWRLRGHLQQAVREDRGGDVLTFGKSDFPLGYALPNTRDVQKPRRVEALADIEVVAVAAAKHHSVVLDVQGRVFTWGHGRGGRLGHGDEHPQMFPKPVLGLGGLRVVKVAAAENHTVCVTDQGMVFTWGSDRFGQLGLGGASAGQGGARLVPRRVEALRRVAVADISAGTTHTVAVTRDGEVYSWGGNKSGQLGYEGVKEGDGVPRMVSLLYHRANGKDPRRAIQVSAGCRCTLVVVEGAAQRPNKVYQFGYGSCVPFRVDFRPAEKAQHETGRRLGASLWLQDRSQRGGGGGARINVVQVSAGMHHNVALSSTGLVYTWGLGADQLGLSAPGGGAIEEGSSGVTHTTCPRVVHGMGQDRGAWVSAAAGHTAVVTDTGDLYTWGATDGQQGILGHGHGSWQPVPKRVVGLKRGIKVAAGPEHTIVLLSASSPPLPHPHADLKAVQQTLVRAQQEREEQEDESRPTSPFSVASSEGDGDLFAIEDVEAMMPLFHGGEAAPKKPPQVPALPSLLVLPTLKALCERTIASHVDIRNAISVLAHAEALDSRELANYCVDFVQRNLDGILVAGRPADLDFLLEDAADEVNTLFQASVAAASPQAQASEEVAAAAAVEMARPSPVATMLARVQRGHDPSLEEALRLERGLRKRLTQVEELARLKAAGTVLSPDQLRKLSRHQILQSEAQAILPLLARLRVLDKARQVREREKEQQQLADEGPVDLKSEEVEHLAAASTPEKPLLPTTYACEVCHVTCANETIWEDHLQGKRHAKRLAKVQAEEAAAKTEAEQAAKAAREKELWPRGAPLPPSSPWNVGTSTMTTPGSTPSGARPCPSSQEDRRRGPMPTTTPSSSSVFSSPSSASKKSFREILEEEERERAAAAGAGRPRGMSMSSNSFGRSPGLSFGSPQSNGKRGTTPLSSSAGPERGGEGSVLLSAYFKNTAAMPRPTPALSTASNWAAQSKAPAAAPPLASAAERSPSVDVPSGSPRREGVSFESIMAEEERKAAQHPIFSGNNCPWFSERRERSHSFDVIQQQERELDALRQEEESRALAEALAVAAAEEEKEMQNELRRAKQQQQRRRSASFSATKKEKKGGEALTALTVGEGSEKATPKKGGGAGGGPRGQQAPKAAAGGGGNSSEKKARRRGHGGGAKGVGAVAPASLPAV